MATYRFRKKKFWTKIRDADRQVTDVMRDGYEIIGFPVEAGIYRNEKEYNQWFVVVLKTGLSIGKGATKPAAIAGAEEAIEKHGGAEGMNALIAEWLKTHEPMPGFRVSTL